MFFVALVAIGVFFIRRRSRSGIREYNEEKDSKSFAMLFRPKKTRAPPSQEPLDGYHVEPVVMGQPYNPSQQHLSMYTTATSYHTPSSNGETASYGVTPYPPASSVSQDGGVRAPLRLHNGEEDPEAPRPQAPPLPRKTTGSSAAGRPPFRAGPNSTVSASEAGSSDVAAELRGEVENLRREMDEIRRAAAPYEPPPEYQ